MTAAVAPTVEARCRAWVASLGEIPEWRLLLAEQAIALARLVDAEIDASKAATASRELRQIVGLLAPTASLSPPAPRPESWSRPEPQVDPIAGLVDEVGRKRDQLGRR